MAQCTDNNDLEQSQTRKINPVSNKRRKFSVYLSDVVIGEEKGNLTSPAFDSHCCKLLTRFLYALGNQGNLSRYRCMSKINDPI